MKLIESGAEIINHDNQYKHIEAIGRMCYKSEDKITEDSCYAFVDNLISRKHYAMLEHGRTTFGVVVNPNCRRPLEELYSIPGVIIIPIYNTNVLKYTYEEDTNYESDLIYVVNVSFSHLYNPRWYANLLNIFRGVVVDDECDEFKCSLDAKDQSEIWRAFTINEDAIKSTELYTMVKHVSIKFLCDRGVSHELVRHRVAIAQESTRYCNYSKSKFGQELAYIYPNHYDNYSDDAKNAICHVLATCEAAYMKLIKEGLSPQEARVILPNGLKTEVVLTMSLQQWGHFLNMRYYGTTGSPHPDMVEVAQAAFTSLIHNPSIRFNLYAVKELSESPVRL